MKQSLWNWLFLSCAISIIIFLAEIVLLLEKLGNNK
jgi:hypothetical protein